MSKLPRIAFAIACAGALSIGCGNGDDNNSMVPGDSGVSPDSSVPSPDSGNPDSGNSDGGACNFATFVKGLIANDTSGTALPSTDLGQSCTDDQNQAEFQ